MFLPGSILAQDLGGIVLQILVKALPMAAFVSRS